MYRGPYLWWNWWFHFYQVNADKVTGPRWSSCLGGVGAIIWAGPGLHNKFNSYPSCLLAKGRVHPGVSRLTYKVKQPFMLTFTTEANLGNPISLSPSGWSQSRKTFFQLFYTLILHSLLHFMHVFLIYSVSLFSILSHFFINMLWNGPTILFHQLDLEWSRQT